MFTITLFINYSVFISYKPTLSFLQVSHGTLKLNIYGVGKKQTVPVAQFHSVYYIV